MELIQPEALFLERVGFGSAYLGTLGWHGMAWDYIGVVIF